jgi:hypothetical protein
MKTKMISKMLLSLGWVFLLESAITQVQGDSSAISPTQLPYSVVTIYSTGDVTRGETGLFILNMNPPPPPGGGTYIYFSVSGTAIPGVDYVPLVSPVYIPGCGGNFCVSGVGVIRVQTLPDPRASAFRRAYSVVVTLKPGVGYAIAEPSSAQMMINP